MTVFEILSDAAKQFESATALVDEYGEISFRELYELAIELRNQMQQSGVSQGVGVGIHAGNGRGFVVALFAVAGCGAVAVPFSDSTTDKEIDELVTELPVAFVVSCAPVSSGQGTSSPRFDVGGLEFVFRQVNSSQELFAPHVPGAVFVRPTSGTTGKSKGVVFSHTTVRERIDIAQETLRLTPDDAVIWVLPMAYHFVVSIVLYVKTGTKIVVCKDHLAETVIDAAHQHGGTVLYAAPTHYTLLAHDSTTKRLPDLRWAICTSGGISALSARQFEARYQVPLRQVYGIIEVGLPIGNFENPPAPVDSIGKPLAGFEVALFDEQGNLCPPGEVGELAVRGPGMFDAYLRPAADRISKLEDGWFLTGDLATCAMDGTVRIAGRKKSVIIVAGNKVFPEEVEHALNEHPAIEVSRVYGADHPLVGEVVSAEVVVRSDGRLSEDEIRKYCRGRLSSFKTPQNIRFVNAVTMTGSGKVVRH